MELLLLFVLHFLWFLFQEKDTQPATKNAPSALLFRPENRFKIPENLMSDLMQRSDPAGPLEIEAVLFRILGMLSCNLDQEPPIVSTCSLLQIFYLIFISCLLNDLRERDSCRSNPGVPSCFPPGFVRPALANCLAFSVSLDAFVGNKIIGNAAHESAWAAKTYADLAAYLVNRSISSAFTKHARGRIPACIPIS
jgi:hypothetical protein